MLRNTIFIFAVLFALSSVASAQATSSGSSQSASSGSTAAPANTSVQPLNFPKDTPVLAKLLTDIDAASAKQGDPVGAEIVEDMRSGREVLLQKGCILSGHITGVELFSSENPKSIVGILFDRVTLRNGEQRSMNVGIRAIAPTEGTRTEAEVNPSIHARDLKGTVGYLDHKSVGAFGMPGVTLGYEITKKGNASLITSTAGNVRLRKGMQVVFSSIG
jgi:hypothetical protein